MPAVRRVIIYTADTASRSLAVGSFQRVEEEAEGYLLGLCQEEGIDALQRDGFVVRELDAPPPTRGRSNVLALSSASRAGLRPGLYALRVEGPVTPKRVAALEKDGIRLLRRTDEGSWLVELGTHRQADALKKYDWVRGLARWSARDDARGRLGTLGAGGTSTPGRSPAGSSAPTKVFEALVEDGASADEVAARAMALGARVLGRSSRKVRFEATEQQKQGLRGDGVQAIQAFVEPKLCNDRATHLIGLPTVRGTIPGLTGKGQKVGVADSGMDPTHPGLSNPAHRVISRLPSGSTVDSVGHGTHVCGTIAGTGAGSAGNALAGVAPEAELVVQVIAEADGSLTGLPVDLYELFRQAYDAGVRIHNNSWCSKVQGLYASGAREADRFVAEHPDFLIVAAAGNDATAADPEDGEQRRSADGFVDWYSLGSPATAKNVLSVGAQRSDRRTGGRAEDRFGGIWPGRFPEAPIAGETLAGDPQCLAAFSGRGPTLDYRVKPDLVAPGTAIASARASTSDKSSFDGMVDGTRNKYGYMSGTSMAAPVVAGAAALVRQHLIKSRDGKTPSAALLRAMLVHGARALSGRDAVADNAGLPNCHQGFGALDLAATLDPALALEIVDDWEAPAGELLPGPLGMHRYSFELSAEGPLRVTLAYTDVPAVHVQNDLSLLLQRPSFGRGPMKQWMGNAGSQTRTRGGDNNNTIEVVRLEKALVGLYVAQVTAQQVPRGVQSYALVVSGPMKPGTWKKL